MMYDIDIDGKLQVFAALSLLESSRLVKWDPDSLQFTPVHREAFDLYWKSVDPVFGRLICWINFSAGAEFLAKGVCLLRGVEFRHAKNDVPASPTTDLQVWATQYLKNSKFAGTVETTNFHTLGDLIGKNKAGPLKQLCIKVKATHQDEELLLAAYDFLCKSIRNRDVHAYRPKVRDDNFPLVPDLFAKCFNLIVSWLPGDPSALNGWSDKADKLIASL